MKKHKRKNPGMLNESDYFKDQIISIMSQLYYRYKYDNTMQVIFDGVLDQLKYIFENCEIEKYINRGSFGRVYKLNLRKSILIGNKIIKPQTYAIKVYNTPIPEDCLQALTIFSKYGIIPKIYLNNFYFMLMNYIDGIPFSELRKQIQLRNASEYIIEEVVRKTEKLEHLIKTLPLKGNFKKLWWNTGLGNIIITKDLKKVYLIDPCG